MVVHTVSNWQVCSGEGGRATSYLDHPRQCVLFSQQSHPRAIIDDTIPCHLSMLLVQCTLPTRLQPPCSHLSPFCPIPAPPALDVTAAVGCQASARSSPCAPLWCSWVPSAAWLMPCGRSTRRSRGRRWWTMKPSPSLLQPYCWAQCMVSGRGPPCCGVPPQGTCSLGHRLRAWP